MNVLLDHNFITIQRLEATEQTMHDDPSLIILNKLVQNYVLSVQDFIVSVDHRSINCHC